MAKVEITEEIVQLIVENKDKTDDEILGLVIGTGQIPFSKAKGVLQKVLIEKGLRITKEQRDEKAAEMLGGFEVSAETTPDDIATQVQELSAELDCSAKVARNYIKALFDEEELNMPKAPKGGGTRGPRAPGFGGDALIAAQFLIDNKDSTREEYAEYLASIGKDKTNKGADKVGTWWGLIEDLRVFTVQWQEAGHCT